MPLYDYLIVGSGLFGATVAHELLKHGKRCLVVEKGDMPEAIFLQKN